jgi:hypothetical protein
LPEFKTPTPINKGRQFLLILKVPLMTMRKEE